MRLSIGKEKDGVFVISAYGKMMGGSHMAACHDKIKDHIASGRNWIVMDLGQVEWMNSSGLGLMIGCMISCRNAGGDMVVARATKKVRSIFMMTQVIKTFDVYPSVKEAVAALKAKMPKEKA